MSGRRPASVSAQLGVFLGIPSPFLRLEGSVGKVALKNCAFSFLKKFLAEVSLAIISNGRVVVGRPTYNNKTAPSVSHRRRQSRAYIQISPGRRTSSPRSSQNGNRPPQFGRRQQKKHSPPQRHGCAQRDREIHISINWRRSSPLMPRMPFASLLNVCRAYAQTAERSSPGFRCLSNPRRL